MIRFKTATILLTVLITSFAVAQSPTPRVQVFGGYALVHADNGGLVPLKVDSDLAEPNEPFSLRNYFQGWNAEGQYNANRWIGVAAEVSGRSGTPITAATGSSASGLPNLSAYTFLAGPVLSYRTKSKLTPFIHALFGWDRARLGAGPIAGVEVPLSSLGTTHADVAAALGGGVDYRLSRRVSLRLAQLDEFYTTHNLNKFYNNAFDTTLFQGFSTHEDNLRVSTGVVVRF
jgi:opacity protein-like surface antigen